MDIQNRYFEIATRLSELRNERASYQNEKLMIEATLEQGELDLTPPEGWPGKNEAERVYNKKMMLATAPGMIALNAQLLDAKKKITFLEAEIDNLHSEEQAIQWTIRDQANAVLGGVSVFSTMQDLAIHGLTEEELEELVDKLAAADGISLDGAPVRTAPGQPENYTNLVPPFAMENDLEAPTPGRDLDALNPDEPTNANYE